MSLLTQNRKMDCHALIARPLGRGNRKDNVGSLVHHKTSNTVFAKKGFSLDAAIHK